MGGSTFTTPAIRMSSDTLDTLTSYCVDRLSPIFPQIERMHHVRSKVDHGDLDLICGVPEGVPIKRQDVGLLGRYQNTGELRIGLGEKEGREGAEETEVIWDGKGSADVKRFAADIAQRLGAVELITFPNASDGESSFLPDDAFYQVDLGLIPPPSFPFYRILTSYSIPYAAIVLALQSLSPAIWLRRDALTLRHSPLAGYPLIDITLSQDYDAVMGLVGLDMDRWEKGFDNREELYKWLVDVKEGSVLEQGWKVVKEHGLGRMGVGWKRFHTRVDGLPEFIEWMRVNRVEPGSVEEPNAGPIQPQAQGPSADSERPTPLGPLAASLLDEFSKRAEYDAQIASHQTDARRVRARQKQREENRQRAEEMKRAKEARLLLECEAEVRARAEAKAEGKDQTGDQAKAGPLHSTSDASALIPGERGIVPATNLSADTDNQDQAGELASDDTTRVEALTLALAIAELDSNSSTEIQATASEAEEGDGDTTLVDVVPDIKHRAVGEGDTEGHTEQHGAGGGAVPTLRQ